MNGQAPGRARGPILHALVVVSGSSATALVIGFAKNALAAYYFGTSAAMDTYLVALLLPDTVMQLARTGAFNLIPLFGAERQKSEADAWSAAGKMLTYWLLLLAAMLLAGVLVAPLAMRLIAPGFSGAERHHALELARLLFLMAASLGAGRILSVVLHAERRFLAVGLAEVASQIGSTAFLVAFHSIGIRGLAWAMVFGGFLQLFVCAWALLPRKRDLRIGLDFGSAPVRKMMRLSLPIYLADSGDKVNQMVSRAFASLYPAGAVSSLQYAYIPVESTHRILATSLTTALFPFLSHLFAQTDRRRARASLSRAIVASAMLFLPLSAIVWLLAEPIVVLLFERGSFDRRSTAMTASALRLFAPSIFALALNELLGSAFHARQDTVTPMRAGYLRVFVHGALCAALSPLLGYRGLALAATISVYCKLLALIWSARRVFPHPEGRRTLQRVAQVTGAVAAMLAAMYPLAVFGSAMLFFKQHALRSICALGLLCAVTYGSAIWLLARRQFFVHAALLRRALPFRWGRGLGRGVIAVAPAGSERAQARG